MTGADSPGKNGVECFALHAELARVRVFYRESTILYILYVLWLSPELVKCALVIIIFFSQLKFS